MLNSLTLHQEITDTSLIELRQNLSSIIHQAFYSNTQFRLNSHNKPIARIVGENFMQSLDVLLEHDASLRETLEIMLDKNMMSMLRQSQSDVQNGYIRPLVDLLTE
jgi:hypothetical protein